MVKQSGGSTVLCFIQLQSLSLMELGMFAVNCPPSQDVAATYLSSRCAHTIPPTLGYLILIPSGYAIQHSRALHLRNMLKEVG